MSSRVTGVDMADLRISYAQIIIEGIQIQSRSLLLASILLLGLGIPQERSFLLQNF
ncbi:MAG: hypothetical protein ACO3NK_04740 [Prochlorotrichaceae cyanobacterium]